MLRWGIGLAALVGLLAIGIGVQGQGLPQMLMYGVFNGAPRALSVDTNGNLNISASISGADGAILDGVSSAVRATVQNLAGNKALAVSIQDGTGTQITSFGGGTQYANGAVQATPTGTVALGWDGANVRALSTNSSGVLAVQSHAVTNAGTFAVQAAQSGSWTVTGTGGTFPVTDSGGSLTVDAPVGTPVFVELSDGVSAITTLPVSLASVPSHAVTNAGTFAVQAAQSGTWTVQPGNTANTTPWLFSISQGGNTAAVNASSQLSVNCANCSGSGVSQQDNTGFTPGTTNMVPIGAEVDDTATTATTENNAGVVRMSTRRELYTQLRDAAGNERGANVNASNQLSVSVDNTVTVGSHNVTNAGTFAVQATQSGTWTVQPGNTANTTAWLVNAGLSTAAAAADAAANPTAGFVQDALSLFNGTTWDRWREAANATNTTGTGIAAIANLLQFDDVSPTAITENQFGNARMSANRNAYTTIRDAAGNERGVNVSAGNALLVDGSATTQPVSQATAANLNVRTDTSGATGAAPPARADYIGGLVGGATGGFVQGVPVCESQAFINMTTATTTELVPLTASRTVHICHLNILANGTTTVTLKRGTGTNCGTGTTAIGPDWNLTAQVGFAMGSGFGEVLDGRSSGNAICVTSSAAVNVQAFARYGVW